MAELLHSDITQQVIGAAFEVHRTLGPGFLERVYEKALCYELGLRGLSFQRQVRVPVYYKDAFVGTHCLDLLVSNKVIVELKAVSDLIDLHSAIVISYLTATRLQVALLMNFDKPSLQFKRLVRQTKSA